MQQQVTIQWRIHPTANSSTDLSKILAANLIYLANKDQHVDFEDLDRVTIREQDTGSWAFLTFINKSTVVLDTASCFRYTFTQGYDRIQDKKFIECTYQGTYEHFFNESVILEFLRPTSIYVSIKTKINDEECEMEHLEFLEEAIRRGQVLHETHYWKDDTMEYILRDQHKAPRWLGCLHEETMEFIGSMPSMNERQSLLDYLVKFDETMTKDEIGSRSIYRNKSKRAYLYERNEYELKKMVVYGSYDEERKARVILGDLLNSKELEYMIKEARYYFEEYMSAFDDNTRVMPIDIFDKIRDMMRLGDDYIKPYFFFKLHDMYAQLKQKSIQVGRSLT